MAAWDGWKKDHEAVMSRVRAGKMQEARRYSFEEANNSFSVSEELLGKIVHLNTAIADESKLLAKSLTKSAQTTLFIAMLVAILLAVGLGIFISRVVLRQLGADPKEVGEIANLVAVGDLSREIHLGAGDSDSVMAAMKKMVDTVRLLVSDAGMLSEAAVAGRLATRADAGKHQGEFKKIVLGVNDTLDAVIGPLNVAGEYMDRISKGDIPPKITDSYNGDFNEIKLNLNNCIDIMNNLLSEADQEGRGGREPG